MKQSTGRRGRIPGRGAGALAALLLSACGRGAPSPDPFAAEAVCTSGTFLDPNYQPSPEMAPGRACISCHLEENAASGEEGDAPLFSFAGTAFATAHEPDYCASPAAGGAIVSVIDARGAAFTATANGSGNFFLEVPGLTPPYRAELIFEGRVRTMTASQSDGDCNGCHTADGANDAPGRVLLP